MRRARITYEGAFHHAMNRGFEGRKIFTYDRDKKKFIDLLAEIQTLTRIRVLAYCVLDNHYHVIIQDTTDRLADFFKQLNGQYATYYRQKYGGRGYVFQDRYKSMLIQDDAYLMVALAYVLNNPVKAGLCDEFTSNLWSSGSCYFSNTPVQWLDSAYIEDLFGSFDNLFCFVDSQRDLDQLPIIKTPMGQVIGGEEFVPQALERADRRFYEPSHEHRRIDDLYHDPVEKVIQEFEKKYNVRLREIDGSSTEGKRLKGDLLVLLKEKAGLRYRDIARFDLFADVGLSSLSMMYKRTKSRKKKWR